MDYFRLIYENYKRIYDEETAVVGDPSISLAIEGSRDLSMRDYELWFEIAELYKQKGDLQKVLESTDRSLEIRYLFRDAIKLREEI
ncbi:MAG: hypothetical protein ACFFAN_13100 [Promethearchaeota archaeon]